MAQAKIHMSTDKSKESWMDRTIGGRGGVVAHYLLPVLSDATHFFFPSLSQHQLNIIAFVYITDWLYNITNKARSERNIAFYMYIKNRLSNVILSKPIKTYLLQDLQSKKYLFNQYNTALKLSSY